jgi:hypothetical protein
VLVFSEVTSICAPLEGSFTVLNVPVLTPEIAARVLAHNKMAIETRKQREIERVLLSSGFYQKSGGDSSLKNDFGGFVRSKIFSPEQIVSIIRNNNWLILFENSEIGKSVRSLFTNFELLTNS